MCGDYIPLSPSQLKQQSGEITESLLQLNQAAKNFQSRIKNSYIRCPRVVSDSGARDPNPTFVSSVLQVQAPVHQAHLVRAT